MNHLNVKFTLYDFYREHSFTATLFDKSIKLIPSVSLLALP